uniref:Laminin subunit alpha-1 n=1 Tax=Callorhinchus milii TaxID=7868 RepID=A0A4W3J550_CALMI
VEFFPPLCAGLFPAILNLASNAMISTNATCGENGPEMFCKLVEHVPGRPIRNPQCRICDLNSTNPRERHSIMYAIDGTNNWWQSPSIQNGRQYHLVTITLDLRQVFQVAYIIIKAANSPRPGNWILEHSSDGVEFKPWQYYATSDAECLTRYNIVPRIGPPTYKRDDEVICTSYYSRLMPLEHGEIHTSLINGRPSADDPSQTLLDFTSARYIRLQLQRIRTLNADLMTLSYRDPKEVDPIVTRRYYYSLKDISVGGMCICYGHARSCPWDETRMCQCEHNTCGESCNECCPGYHQHPWKSGNFTSENVCEKCNCHGKAEDCYYDQNVADRNMSMNTLGQYIGGGVCINCTNNTAGINCETCIDGYYRPQEVSPHERAPCLPCSCDLSGNLHSLTSHSPLAASLAPGQCHCQEGYAGRRCDRCAFGFRGFPHCVRCNCSLIGSINEDPCSEPCQCKTNVEGEDCDQCKEGFYNLQERNPEGCTECFCFGVSSLCKSIPWPITQVTDIKNWRVTDIQGVKSVKPQQDLFDGLNQISINNTEARQGLPALYYWTAPDSYLRNKVNWKILALMAGMMPIICAFRLSSVTLDVANPNAIDVLPAVDVEHCECPPGYTGISCESCGPGFYRVGGILFGGICQQCECNGHATHCDTDGACSDCQHNTTGPNCDRCLPGLYGDPTQGTPEDCKPCACPLLISSNNFSPTCHLNKGGEVICDQCRQGYAGPRCDRCADGYYGNPGIPGGWCSPCFCNGNVDPAEPGHCHPVTGDCLKCLGHTDGRLCERCAEGYYGDALVAKDCRACGCNVNGSYHMACDRQTGRCECKPNVVGVQCDRCLHGYFGLGTGLGCVPCNCSRLGSISEDCSEDGQCRCVLGVTAEKCDRCAHGYYGFQNGGCKPCDCVHTQNNCAAESGQCICPPHTQGAKCELCAANSWGHDPESGCKPCNCSEVGSDSLQCNGTSGQCPCRPEFGGGACRECAVGYRDYPECIACMCNINGTQPGSCDPARGECSCAQHTGLCPCKESVSGVRCDECKTGSFALSLSNPAGCSRCFCSGVSDSCSELQGLVRIPLSLTPDQLSLRVVSQGNLIGTIEGVYVQPPEVLLDAVLVQKHLKTEPYYWMLPALFTRDKLLAYGGTLRYAMAYYALEGSGSLNLEPQILLKGGQNSKIVIYRDMDTPSNGQQSQHEIDLTEHDWKYFNSVSDAPVTRADFMSVLSNIEYILIKASYGRGLQQSRISNITMEIAMEEDDTHAGRERAHQIEICDCPPGYAGLSCQVCAPGFYREMTELEANVPRSLNQPCMSCQCNNHSNVCDLDTGKCQGCRDHTAGDHCEQCAQGYYGRVNGSINDCSLCACPRHNSGSFSLTCVPEGLSDFRCDSCLPGYEGQYCQRCAPGYYGDPRVPGGRCQLCECNRSGSLHNNCDSLLGHCLCKSGVMGRLCDECEPRHVLGSVLACDDDCTGLLLSDLEKMETMFMSFNMTGFVPAPFDVSLRFNFLPPSFSTPPPHHHFLHFTAVAAGKRVKEIETQANYLLDRLKPLKLLEDNLSRNLSEIKELINQARKQAASIKVAVAADRDCVRAYQPALHSSNHNTLTLNVKTSEPDNLLFYLGSSTSTEFLAVEMRRGRVAFLWDVGSGTTRLEYPDLQINNNKWHRINAARFGRLGTLSVQDVSVSSLEKPGLKKTTSPGISTVLDVNDSTLVFVGGLSGQVKKAPAVKVTHFKGCMGETFLNGMPIGLWNYREKEGKCGGCFSRPQNEDHSFHYDGNGYSVVEKTLRTTATQIVMHFSTFSPNGLLLYLVSSGMRDFLAVELVDGKVRVSFDLGSGILALTSERRYNNGTWIKVAFQRNRKIGKALFGHSLPTRINTMPPLFHIELLSLTSCRIVTLQVDEGNLSEVRLGSSTDNSPLNITKLYVGGVPAGEGVANLKVSTGWKWVWLHRGKNCRSCFPVSFRFTLQLKIRTFASSGLVYYMANQNQVDFAALQLWEGRLRFLFDLGKGAAIAMLPKPINDGKWHMYSKKRGTVSVDGEESSPSMAEGNLLDVEGKLYLGGLPQDLIPKKIKNVTHSVPACISSVSLNNKPLDTERPLSILTVGRCYTVVQEGTFFDGTGFAALVKGGYRVRSDMIVEFEFRTTLRNAVLFGISSAKVDAIGLEMVNSKILFHVNNGAGRITARYEPRDTNGLCDGKWHKLQASKGKHHIELTVDGITVQANNPHFQSTSADTNDPVYVGGYPANVKQNCLTLQTPFQGCVRNLKLTRNQQTEAFDLSRAFDLRGVFPHSCPGAEH